MTIATLEIPTKERKDMEREERKKEREEVVFITERSSPSLSETLLYILELLLCNICMYVNFQKRNILFITSVFKYYITGHLLKILYFLPYAITMVPRFFSKKRSEANDSDTILSFISGTYLFEVFVLIFL